MRTRLTIVAVLATTMLAACGGAEVVGEADAPADAPAGTEAAAGGDAGSEGAEAPAEGGAMDIAVVPKAVGFDFWEQVRLGAECAATTAGDVTVQWDGVTAETDVTGQLNLLQNFVTQGVDGLVYAATDAQVLTDATTAALEADIPVVNIDSGTDPQPDDVPLFATDNEAGAAQAADLLAEQLPDGGEIALLSFQPGTATNDQRVNGFTAGLENHPNLELVAEQSSQSDYNTALSVTENILTANPELDGLFAANEPSVIGAVEAIRQAGRAGEIAVIGWDASPDEIAALEEGLISALVVQNPFRMGFDGVNAAVALANGETAESGDTGVTFVTQENLESEEVQAVLAPSCDDPPTGDAGGGAGASEEATADTAASESGAS